MNTPIRVRLMKYEDFDAVIRIDARILASPRPDYYKYKFDKLFISREYIPTSLVAENEEGAVVGFIMGELYMGEYGIIQQTATLDTLGVDPAHQRKGIGRLLFHEFLDHLRSLGVEKISTLVDRDDPELTHFFNNNGFNPSKIISLERKI